MLHQIVLHTCANTVLQCRADDTAGCILAEALCHHLADLTLGNILGYLPRHTAIDTKERSICSK